MSRPTTASRRNLPSFVLVAFLLALLGACATNPVTGKREFTLMSEAQEIQLGLQSDQEVRQEMGLYEDTNLQRYVQDVGARLAATSERPTLQWHFAVVDVAAVNAFALPGGYIYITRGILPYLESEAELAGVIGHEIGHVTARHAAQQYTRATVAQAGLVGLGLFSRQARTFGNLAGTGLGVLFLKYGRDDERQADALGVRYASRAGWDPNGVPRLLATLARLEAGSDKRGVPNWLLTHPQPAERVGDVAPSVQEAERVSQGREWTVERAAYLQRIDGIIFGDNPREGIVRGNRFLHPELRLAVEFPEGWSINNGKSEVVAASPEQNAILVLQVLRGGAGRSPRDVAEESMGRAGFTAIEGRAMTINGLDAFVGSYEGMLEGIGSARVRAAHLSLRNQLYVLAGVCPAAAAPQLSPRFDASIRSFRELPAAEADAIRPSRVALRTVRAGDTWETLARQGGGGVAAATLAVMNGYRAAEQPRAGERVKIVVAE